MRELAIVLNSLVLVFFMLCLMKPGQLPKDDIVALFAFIGVVAIFPIINLIALAKSQPKKVKEKKKIEALEKEGTEGG